MLHPEGADSASSIGGWAARTRARAQTAWIAGAWLLLALQVGAVAVQWRFYQYDFRAYYIGPLLMLEGQDPYSEEALVRVSRQLGLASNDHPFLYPPYMLAVFLPLTLLPYRAAFMLWLLGLCAALLIIYRVGRTKLELDAAWLVPLLAFGANGASAACFRSGQISLVVSMCLVLGVAALQNGRVGRFSALVVGSALPKLWTLPMLGVALFSKFQPTVVKRAAVLIAAALVAPLVIAAAALLAPDYWHSFLAAAAAESRLGSAGPNGPIDASALNFYRSLAGTGGAPAAALYVYGLHSLAVALTTILVCRRRFQLADTFEPAVAWVGLLGLALVAPRLLTYQWTIVLPALAYVVPRIESRWLRWSVAALLFAPTVYVNRYAFRSEPDVPVENVAMVLWSFTSTIGLFLAWFAAVRGGLRMENRKSLQPPAAPASG